MSLLALQLGERLKLSDPLLLEMPEQDQMLEPDWLVQLRACCREWEVRRSGDAGRHRVLHCSLPVEASSFSVLNPRRQVWRLEGCFYLGTFPLGL